MQRRKFLIGAAGTAIGGSALLGSGAFTRVESQRSVTVTVAADPDAYLGMSVIENSLNSTNFASIDENGHLEIDVGDFGADGDDDYDYDTGLGVNSNSFTYFDDLFRLCNQGKADAMISYELPEPPADSGIGADWVAPDPNYDEQVIAFYFVRDDGTRVIVEEGEEVPLEVGECDNVGLRTVTKGIDADIGELIDGDVVITADSPEAGEFQA